MQLHSPLFLHLHSLFSLHVHSAPGFQGQQSEWALLKRHPSEDIFGVQICGAHPDSVARWVQLLDDNIDADFIDINMGCPIDLVRLWPPISLHNLQPCSCVALVFLPAPLPDAWP